MKTKKNLPTVCILLLIFFTCATALGDTTTVRVAAVQTQSIEGDVAANLKNATALVEAAAADGAYLILLPEVMPSGYVVSTELWDAGETDNGPTVTWLKETSRRLGVWLGTSFIEAEGEHFYNSFVMTNPQAEIAGTVRKQELPGHETLYTKKYAGPHVIETDFGTVGVGICYETTLCFFMRMMHELSVDLVLLPTADPVPQAEADRPPEQWDHNLMETALLYAQALGVPAVLANQGGEWHSPLLGGLLPDQDSIFRGQSTIADSDGTVTETLDQEEGVIVGDVVLDPDRKNPAVPECYGLYCKEMPPGTDLYQAITETIGTMYYSLSIERMQKALAISSGE